MSLRIWTSTLCRVPKDYKGLLHCKILKCESMRICHKQFFRSSVILSLLLFLLCGCRVIAWISVCVGICHGVIWEDWKNIWQKPMPLVTERFQDHWEWTDDGVPPLSYLQMRRSKHLNSKNDWWYCWGRENRCESGWGRTFLTKDYCGVYRSAWTAE